MEKEDLFQKLSRHFNNFKEKEASGELIDLTEIYDDVGRPPYKSPKRILHYPSGKKFIEAEIENNDMQVEKVIAYGGDKVYANYQLAMLYLKSVDVYCNLIVTQLELSSHLKTINNHLNSLLNELKNFNNSY